MPELGFPLGNFTSDNNYYRSSSAFTNQLVYNYSYLGVSSKGAPNPGVRQLRPAL